MFSVLSKTPLICFSLSCILAGVVSSSEKYPFSRRTLEIYDASELGDPSKEIILRRFRCPKTVSFKLSELNFLEENASQRRLFKFLKYIDNLDAPRTIDYSLKIKKIRIQQEGMHVTHHLENGRKVHFFNIPWKKIYHLKSLEKLQVRPVFSCLSTSTSIRIFGNNLRKLRNLRTLDTAGAPIYNLPAIYKTQKLLLTYPKIIKNFSRLPKLEQLNTPLIEGPFTIEILRILKKIPALKGLTLNVLLNGRNYSPREEKEEKIRLATLVPDDLGELAQELQRISLSFPWNTKYTSSPFLQSLFLLFKDVPYKSSKIETDFEFCKEILEMKDFQLYSSYLKELEIDNVKDKLSIGEFIELLEKIFDNEKENAFIGQLRKLIINDIAEEPFQPYTLDGTKILIVSTSKLEKLLRSCPLNNLEHFEFFGIAPEIGIWLLNNPTFQPKHFGCPAGTFLKHPIDLSKKSKDCFKNLFIKVNTKEIQELLNTMDNVFPQDKFLDTFTLKIRLSTEETINKTFSNQSILALLSKGSSLASRSSIIKIIVSTNVDANPSDDIQDGNLSSIKFNLKKNFPKLTTLIIERSFLPKYVITI